MSSTGKTTVEALPEECLSLVFSLTSPGDACRSAAACTAFRVAADSDLTWEAFLPSDIIDIISTSVSTVEFSSKKDLFRRLSTAPLLVDGGKKVILLLSDATSLEYHVVYNDGDFEDLFLCATFSCFNLIPFSGSLTHGPRIMVTFSIDKCSSKKIYMLSARDLSITWSTNSLYWSWKPLLGSRFPEVVELVMVCWLEIKGKISIGLLSPNTIYVAYLIIEVADRAFGLDMVPTEVSIEVGAYKVQKTFYLKCDKCKRQGLENSKERENQTICPRGDGWSEVELGEFYNNGNGGDEEVKMWFREVKGVHLKGGIVVEGIELRPKQRQKPLYFCKIMYS